MDHFECRDSLIGKTDGLYPSVAGSSPAPGSCEECSQPTKNPRFCSLSCSVRNQQKSKAWPIGYCDHCRRIFSKRNKPNNRFCSRSCSASFNNKLFPKRSKSSSPYNKCLFCSAEKKREVNKYCSLECSAKHKTQKSIEGWISGIDPGYNLKTGQLKSFIRHWILSQKNYRCEKCGWNEVNPSTGKVPVEVNHKDGDWKNNSPSNLEVVCPNCHSLTPNFRALNSGYGRPGRKRE